MAEVEALAGAIRAFEEEFECYTVLHGFTREICRVVNFLPNIHTNPYCSILKEKRYHLINPLCRSFDCHYMNGTLRSHPEGVFKYCHAEILEFVVPVFVHNYLAGMMFIGPFRCRMSEFPEGTVVSAHTCPGLDAFYEQKNKLACLSPERAERLKQIVFLLISTIQYMVETSKEANSLGSRRDRINHFFLNRFHHNVGLTDLAEHLGLSASRTTQILREEFGQGFPELLAERRVDYAKRLLSHSSFTATAIAEHSGFTDSCYFFRIFKKLTGMSPGEFRQTHSIDHSS